MFTRPGQNDSLPTSIAAQAKARLQASPYPSIRNIFCMYDEGILVLLGRVPSFFQKQLAQIAVANIEGVRQIVNRVEVQDGAALSPVSITQEQGGPTCSFYPGNGRKA